jgi:hypothetical protein
VGETWGRLVDHFFLSNFDSAPPSVFTTYAEARVLRPMKMVSACIVDIDYVLILT